MVKMSKIITMIQDMQFLLKPCFVRLPNMQVHKTTAMVSTVIEKQHNCEHGGVKMNFIVKHAW